MCRKAIISNYERDCSKENRAEQGAGDWRKRPAGSCRDREVSFLGLGCGRRLTPQARAAQRPGRSVSVGRSAGRILRFGRLRLRGPAGAREEFLLAATAQNLRKLAKLRSTPTAFA
jgi:hypothetical protein